MFDKLFSLDNKPRVNFYNFKDRKYKRQPYYIKLSFKSTVIKLEFFPLTFELLNTFEGKTFCISLPDFQIQCNKFGQMDYKTFSKSFVDYDDIPF